MSPRVALCSLARGLDADLAQGCPCPNGVHSGPQAVQRTAGIPRSFPRRARQRTHQAVRPPTRRRTVRAPRRGRHRPRLLRRPAPGPRDRQRVALALVADRHQPWPLHATARRGHVPQPQSSRPSAQCHSPASIARACATGSPGCPTPTGPRSPPRRRSRPSRCSTN